MPAVTRTDKLHAPLLSLEQVRAAPARLRWLSRQGAAALPGDRASLEISPFSLHGFQARSPEGELALRAKSHLR